MLSNPFIAFLFLLFIWGLNALSSFLYLKKVNGRIIYFKQKFSGSNKHLSAIVNNVTKLRKVMMIMIIDDDGYITNCEYLYSITNFSKFKKKNDVIGKNINQIEKFEKDKFYGAYLECIEKAKENDFIHD